MGNNNVGSSKKSQRSSRSSHRFATTPTLKSGQKYICELTDKKFDTSKEIYYPKKSPKKDTVNIYAWNRNTHRKRLVQSVPNPGSKYLVNVTKEGYVVRSNMKKH